MHEHKEKKGKMYPQLKQDKTVYTLRMLSPTQNAMFRRKTRVI